MSFFFIGITIAEGLGNVSSRCLALLYRLKRRKTFGMNIMKRMALGGFLIAIHLFGQNMATAQIDMQWDVNPAYDQQDIAGFRLGGLDVALPSKVPNTVGNPAHLSALNHISVYASLRNVRSFFIFRNQITNDHTSDYWRQGIAPGYSAVAAPLLGRVVLALSYNGEQVPLIKTSVLSNTTTLFFHYAQ